MERSKNDFWDYLEHGQQWKEHKYIRIENGKYIYPEDLKKTAQNIGNTVKKTAKNVENTVQKTTKNVGDAVEKTAKNVKQNNPITKAVQNKEAEQKKIQQKYSHLVEYQLNKIENIENNPDVNNVGKMKDFINNSEELLNDLYQQVGLPSDAYETTSMDKYMKKLGPDLWHNAMLLEGKIREVKKQLNMEDKTKKRKERITVTSHNVTAW